MISILKIAENHFGFLLMLSATVALLAPQLFLWAAELSDELLMFALFLGCLKIDFSDIIHLKGNFLKLIFFVLLNIVFAPLIFYLLTPFLSEDLRIGFFLLFAASGAVVTPMLASFLGLKVLWSTAFVVFTSILIPFTVPLLASELFGIVIDISIFDMTMFLAKIVFIPALLAILFNKYFRTITKTLLPFTGGIGSINMAFFLGILFAINHEALLKNLFDFSVLPILVGLFVLFCFRFLLGFYMPFENLKERWTNSLMFGNMNNGLMILLAAEFFTPTVLLVVLLSEIPWVIAQPVFQKIVRKYYVQNTIKSASL